MNMFVLDTIYKPKLCSPEQIIGATDLNEK